MANKDDKLISLVKRGRKPGVAKKPEVKVEKPLSLEEERDVKAKARVEELLYGVDLTLKDKEKDVTYGKSEEPKGMEWLQEQVGLLSSENENLRNEMNVAKEAYSKILSENQRIKTGSGVINDEEIMKGVMTIFHEIQSGYLKNPGATQMGTPSFVIFPAAFLNRMIMYFPFLKKEKRF